MELVSDGPVKTVYRVDKSFLGLSKERYYPTEGFPSSFFTQYITLYKGLDRLDIRTEADWWEDHLSLKACFPVDVKADKAYFEIPFAAIGRTTRFETLWEKARYEVPALRWADLADDKGGIALLNDSKYGHDIHGNVMKLSLLRSPTWPDPMADRGRHEFTYSIYPHAGSWSDGQVVRRGQELNQPLLTHIALDEQGRCAIQPLLFLGRWRRGDPRRGQAGRGRQRPGPPPLRSQRQGGDAALSLLPQPPGRVAACDLLENETGALEVKGDRIALSFRPFEIKTIKVGFARMEEPVK